MNQVISRKLKKKQQKTTYNIIIKSKNDYFCTVKYKF